MEEIALAQRGRQLLYRGGTDGHGRYGDEEEEVLYADALHGVSMRRPCRDVVAWERQRRDYTVHERRQGRHSVRGYYVRSRGFDQLP